MKGTEKQIKWAEEIKKKILDEIKDSCDESRRSHYFFPEKFDEAVATYKTLKTKIEAIESATWFIDHRYQDAFHLAIEFDLD